MSAILNRAATGDIILTKKRRPKLLQKLITFFQKGNPYTHAGILLSLHGSFYICDSSKSATSNGVRLVPLNHYVNAEYDYLYLRFKGEVSESRRGAILDFCLRSIGQRKYDFWSLILFHPIKFITGYWCGNEETRLVTCSEWVAFVYDTFFGIFPDYEQVKPSDLFYSEKLEKC